MNIIAFIIWLIVILLIGGAALAVVRSILGWPQFANLQPYTNTVYALIVLLFVLLFVSLLYNGALPGLTSAPSLRRFP